jgi:prepilin peptidase CpaA
MTFQIIAFFLTLLMLTVIVTDVRSYLIPNWLVGLLLLLYPVSLALLHLPDWPGALLAGGIMFAVGFALFALRLMGGGDVKLLAVASLYAGRSQILPYLALVAVLGGLLALFLLLARPVIGYFFSSLKRPYPIPRLFRIDEPVPYGVAIALAFLYLLWSGALPGLK